MLYNIEKKQKQTMLTCATCPYMDKKTLLCSGINKACFEYDEKTDTIIDGITKLPLNLNEKEN